MVTFPKTSGRVHQKAKVQHFETGMGLQRFCGQDHTQGGVHVLWSIARLEPVFDTDRFVERLLNTAVLLQDPVDIRDLGRIAFLIDFVM